MNKKELNYWKKEIKQTIYMHYKTFEPKGYPVEKGRRYKDEIKALNEIVRLAKLSIEIGFKGIVKYNEEKLCNARFQLMLSEEKLKEARKKAEYIKNRGQNVSKA